MLPTVSAAGEDLVPMSLPALQSKMKCDPEGYEAEFIRYLKHFDSSLCLFKSHVSHHAAAAVYDAKDLGGLTLFLAHVAPFYPSYLAEFPAKIIELLSFYASSLPSTLRCHFAQALILLVNRKFVVMEDTLELFMGLQVIGDKTLRKLAFSHVVHHIRRINLKHKNEQINRKLQNILFTMLEGEDESKTKRSLAVLCDLHRRRVWFDDRTANAICRACFHASSSVMIAALSFILGIERVEDYDSEESSDEDDTTMQNVQITVSKEALYKAHHKGTVASKKKKKAKLQRVMRSMKKQQRLSCDTRTSNSYSPLAHLKDAQGFAEKLFSRLQKCNERFEVRLMMVKVIARTVGLHKLILLSFYPYLQNYVKRGQRDLLDLLAAAVQACHDMVPPDAVAPLLKQLLRDYVHDHSRPEETAVLLNVAREICLRMPLLTLEDPLPDLESYAKKRGKAVSSSVRSLIALFKEVNPSLLSKKYRGRAVNPNARPKAFGEVSVYSDVPDAELLHQQHDGITNDSSNEGDISDIDWSHNQFNIESDGVTGFFSESEEEKGYLDVYVDGDGDDDMEDNVCDGRIEGPGADDDDEESEDETYVDDDDENINMSEVCVVDDDDNNCSYDISLVDTDAENENMPKGQKRKYGDYVQELNSVDKSLRALKSMMAERSTNLNCGIFSNEDFQHIKYLKAEKEWKLASCFKIPSSERLRVKPVDPAKLEVNVKTTLSKEERLTLIKAGREERGAYRARTAVKQKKSGGLSNRQKEHKKAMPLAAKRAKIYRSRQDKQKKQKSLGKQFLGKKAWK